MIDDNVDLLLKDYAKQIKDFEQRIERHGISGYNLQNFKERLDYLLQDIIFEGLFTEQRTTRMANEYLLLVDKLVNGGCTPREASRIAVALLANVNLRPE